MLDLVLRKLPAKIKRTFHSQRCCSTKYDPVIRFEGRRIMACYTHTHTHGHSHTHTFGSGIPLLQQKLQKRDRSGVQKVAKLLLRSRSATRTSHLIWPVGWTRPSGFDMRVCGSVEVTKHPTPNSHARRRTLQSTPLMSTLTALWIKTADRKRNACPSLTISSHFSCTRSTPPPPSP